MTALTIRRNQLAALQIPVRAGIERRGAEMVRQHWPVRAARMGEEGLRDFVTKAIDEALSHGVSNMRLSLRYLNVAVALGLNVAGRHPWAGGILADAALDPDTRVDRLMEGAREELAGGAAS